MCTNVTGTLIEYYNRIIRFRGQSFVIALKRIWKQNTNNTSQFNDFQNCVRIQLIIFTIITRVIFIIRTILTKWHVRAHSWLRSLNRCGPRYRIRTANVVLYTACIMNALVCWVAVDSSYNATYYVINQCWISIAFV